AAGRESHARLEFHRNPIRVLADSDVKRFGVDLNPSLGALYIRTEFELRAQLSAGAQRILGTRNVGMKACAIPLDGNSHTALAKLVAANARGAETECALTPFQIGNAHAGEQHAGKLFGRESHWNANHRTENSPLAQPMPERCSAAQAFDLGLAERQRVFADAQVALGLADLR